MVLINKVVLGFFPARAIKIIIRKRTIYIVKMMMDELHVAARCHTIMTDARIQHYYF